LRVFKRGFRGGSARDDGVRACVRLLYVCMFLPISTDYRVSFMYPCIHISISQCFLSDISHTNRACVRGGEPGVRKPMVNSSNLLSRRKNNRRNTFEYRWIYETCGNSSYNTRSEKSSNQPRRTGVHTFAPPRYHSKKHAQPRTLLHDPPVVRMGRHSDIRIRRTPWWSTPIICQLHTNHFQNPTLHPLHNIRSQNRTLM